MFKKKQICRLHPTLVVPLVLSVTVCHGLAAIQRARPLLNQVEMLKPAALLCMSVSWGRSQIWVLAARSG